MQLETAINRLIKYLNRRTEELSAALTSGGIDGMEKYNYIVGQITALEATKQELSNLLEDKERMEQSSTSTIKLPDKKLVGVKKEKDLTKEDSNKLPQPTGWEDVSLPFKMKEKTKGGLYMAETALERQQVASQCGLVLRMGQIAGKDKERYPDGPWCKEGEWVMFARYAGSRIKIEGGEIRLLNDDEVLATIKNPEDILHEY